MPPVQKTFPAELECLGAIRDFVAAAAGAAGRSAPEIDSIVLAVDEACSNIILHGYKGQGGEIAVWCAESARRFDVGLLDRAPPFNPLKEAPEPALDQPLDARLPGGLGVLLIRQNTSRQTHHPRAGGGNELIISVGSVEETTDE